MKKATEYGPRPVDLVTKYRFIKALLSTRWSTALDHNIGMRIVERYKDEHGNGRVALRFLETGTGATRPSVIASLRRLVENGAFAVIRQGAGTRPTEYLPIWDFASGIAENTSGGIVDHTTTSGVTDDTSTGIAGTTSGDRSGITQDTESHLLKATYKGEPTVEGSKKDDFAGGLAAPAVAFPLPKRWTIVGADLIKNDDDPDFVAIDLEAEDGSTVTDYFDLDPIDGFDPGSRWDDLMKYAELLCEVGGTEDLVGVRVWAFGEENAMTYLSEWQAAGMLPANDNLMPVQAVTRLPPGKRPWTQ